MGFSHHVLLGPIVVPGGELGKWGYLAKWGLLVKGGHPRRPGMPSEAGTRRALWPVEVGQPGMPPRLWEGEHCAQE